MSLKDSEEFSVRISNVLNGLCPAFRKQNSKAPYEWHRCKCLAIGGTCTCVWHRTNKCAAGTWSQLSFAAEYRTKKRAARNEALNKVREVIAKGGGAASESPEPKEVTREDLIDLEE